MHINEGTYSCTRESPSGRNGRNDFPRLRRFRDHDAGKRSTHCRIAELHQGSLYGRVRQFDLLELKFNLGAQSFNLGAGGFKRLLRD